MPFGLIFGALFFTVAAAMFATRMIVFRPFSMALQVSLAIACAGLAAGLVLRQRWARWSGVAAAAACASLGALLVLGGGSAPEILVLLASAITLALLLVPATGDVRRGLPEGRSTSSRRGAVVGYVVAAAFVAATISFGTARLGEQPEANPAIPAAYAGVDWLDYGPGLARAAAEGKPVLVDFFATWCGPCKIMDRKTFHDPEVIRELDAVVPVRIDAEGSNPVAGYRGLDLADRYGVDVYPTLVLMDADGREIARSTGALPPDRFMAWLQRALASARGSTSQPPVGAVSM